MEFIDLAETMLREGSPAKMTQAVLRTAMNRAYLGALMTTASRLTGLTGSAYPRDYTFYETVERDLQRVLPGLGDMLATLRTHRRDADYDLETDILPRRCEHSIRLARSYIARMDEKLN